MKLIFESIDSGSGLMKYESEYEIIDDVIIFDENENTKIKIKKISEDRILINRLGQIETDLDLIKNNITESSFNMNGLSFNFKVKTIELIFENNKIFIEYETIMDDFISNHKINIIMNA